jgi:hypothetical protein
MDTDDMTMNHAGSQAVYTGSYVAGQKMLDLCFVLDVTGR